MRDDLARFLRDELGADNTSADDASWTVTATIWVWRGNGDGPPPKAAWYFLTISGETVEAMRGAAGRVGGFGSIKVTACIGATQWTTSLFRSKDAGGYLLPIKADVRRRERLLADQPATVTLTLA